MSVVTDNYHLSLPSFFKTKHCRKLISWQLQTSSVQCKCS